LDEYREKCRDAGMNGFLTKPVDAGGLQQAVSQFLFAGVQTGIVTEQSPEKGHSQKRLDRKDALARCGNNEDLLLEIWAIFAQETPEITRQMNKAIEKTDLNTLLFTAHNLKSASERIGAMIARDLAGNLEVMAKEGNTDSLALFANDLSHELEAVITLIQNDKTPGKEPMA